MLQSQAVSFFFNDTATTEIYTLSLHDALPISRKIGPNGQGPVARAGRIEVRSQACSHQSEDGDRKSTRLNSSHANISYAVFCLKKKYRAKGSTSCSRSCTKSQTDSIA